MKYFKQKKIDIVLLVINDWGSLKTEFESQFPVFYLNTSSTPKKKSIFKKEKSAIEKIKDIHQIDLIYLNTIASVDLLPELGQTFKVPIISHIHELQYSIAQYGSSDSMENLFKYSSKIIACSQAVADNLKIYKDSGDIRIVHSFVENDNILNLSKKSNKTAIREQYGLADGKVWVCACGNADWRKAPDVFLQIAAQILKETDRFGFTWVGIENEGEQFEQLRYDARKLGIENKIKWINPTIDAVEIINSCDVFLVSSREDPFPLVVLEAALCGKPIFGFKNTGGVDEFIDVTCGSKVDYLNISQMAKEIIKLDTSSISDLGANAKAKVLKNYSFDISIRKIDAIFNEIV
jgi:glycosyltransferase involved in cell wall biosynthesis